MLLQVSEGPGRGRVHRTHVCASAEAKRESGGVPGARLGTGVGKPPGKISGRKEEERQSEVCKKKKKVEKDGLRRGMASTRAWWEGEFRVGGSVYVEASLCCPLQGRRGRDACLYQVSHPPAPSLCCFDSSGLAGPSPSFLSPTGWQPDSLSKGAFSLLSWKTLLLAPQGFQFSGAQP